MSYKILTRYEQLDLQKWGRFVSTHLDGIIFQSPEMFRVFCKTKNYTPVLVACIDEQKNELTGILVSVIQKDFSRIIGFLSARSVIWGGPLTPEDLLKQVHSKRRNEIWKAEKEHVTVRDDVYPNL